MYILNSYIPLVQNKFRLKFLRNKFWLKFQKNKFILKFVVNLDNFILHECLTIINQSRFIWRSLRQP